MPDQRCTSCGSPQLEPGWIGDGANMVALWVEGPLKRHLLGAPRIEGPQLDIKALRCGSCGHLELFAPDSDE